MQDATGLAQGVHHSREPDVKILPLHALGSIVEREKNRHWVLSGHPLEWRLAPCGGAAAPRQQGRGRCSAGPLHHRHDAQRPSGCVLLHPACPGCCGLGRWWCGLRHPLGCHHGCVRPCRACRGRGHLRLGLRWHELCCSLERHHGCIRLRPARIRHRHLGHRGHGLRHPLGHHHGCVRLLLAWRSRGCLLGNHRGHGRHRGRRQTGQRGHKVSATPAQNRGDVGQRCPSGLKGKALLGRQPQGVAPSQESARGKRA